MQALEQSAPGLGFGGLGFRKAAMLAAPAHLASLIESRPCVTALLQLALQARVNLPSAISTYDSHIARAQEDCLVRLAASKAPLFEILCSNAADTCRMV